MNRNRFSAVATISVPTLGIKGKKIGTKEKYVETIDPAPSTPAGEPLGEIQVEVSEEVAKKLKEQWPVQVAKNEPTPLVALLGTTFPEELPHWSRDIPAPPSDTTEDKDTLVEKIWSADGLPPLSLGSLQKTNKGLGRPSKFIDEQSFYHAAERVRALKLRKKTKSTDDPALSPPQVVQEESEAKPSQTTEKKPTPTPKDLALKNSAPTSQTTKPQRGERAKPRVNEVQPWVQPDPESEALKGRDTPINTQALQPDNFSEKLPSQTTEKKSTPTPKDLALENSAPTSQTTKPQRGERPNPGVNEEQPRVQPSPESEALKGRDIPVNAQALQPDNFSELPHPLDENIVEEPTPSTAPSLFRSRAFAALIDISVACSFFVLGLLFFPDPPRVLPFVFAALYLLTKDSLGILNGQSIGKKIMRLRAVNSRHRSLAGNYKTGLIRNLSWLFAPIEFAILYVREDEVTIGKRLGDDWAETEVIAEEKPLPRKSKWLP